MVLIFLINIKVDIFNLSIYFVMTKKHPSFLKILILYIYDMIKLIHDL